MPEIARLTGHSEWIDLGFVERERTPEPAMALGIQSYVSGLWLSNTVELLVTLGVERSRKAVHDWVQKAELQPESGHSPNQVVLDETVIRINDQQFWLYTAGTPQTNDLLHVRLFPTTTTAASEIFFSELQQKHDVETASFSLMAPNTSKLLVDEERDHGEPEDVEHEINLKDDVSPGARVHVHQREQREQTDDGKRNQQERQERVHIADDTPERLTFRGLVLSFHGISGRFMASVAFPVSPSVE